MPLRPLQEHFRPIRSPNAPQQKERTTTRLKAIEAKYKMYWNGKPCKYGHVSVRYSYTGKCKKCIQLWRGDEIDFQDIDTDYMNDRRNTFTFQKGPPNVGTK